MALKKTAGKALTNVYKGSADVVPGKVRAKVGLTRVQQAQPNDVDPTTLTSTLVESKVETDRTDERVKTNSTLGAATATFAGQLITEDNQVATVTENWAATPTISVSALTISGEVEDTGVGKMAREVTVASLFDEKLERIEIADLLPDRFAASVPTTTLEVTSAATDTTVSLAAGELSVEKRRVDATKVRTTTRSRATNSGSISGQKKLTSEFGGGIVAITDAFNTSTLTVDEGLMVLASEVIKVGQWYVKRTETVEGASWPILEGTNVDERLGVVTSYAKQVVAAGTMGGVSGSAYTVVQPIDKWRSLEIVSEVVLTSLPGTDGGPPAVSYFALVDGNFFPDILESVSMLEAEATAGSRLAYDAAPVMVVKRSTGPYEALITEVYTIGPPEEADFEDFTFAAYSPQGGTFGYAFEAWSTTGFVTANARTFEVPVSLHDAITPTGGATSFGSIAATTPVNWGTPGEYVAFKCSPERIGNGVWRTDVLEIKIPA